MIYRWCDFSRSDRKESGRLFAVIWIALLVFLLPDAAGQSSQKSAPPVLPPGIETHVKATPEIATVGDPIRIELEVTAPSGYRVEILRPEMQTGDFSILEFSAGPATPHLEESGKAVTAFPPQQHFQAQILAALYKTGKFIFPPIKMELAAAGGKEIAFSSSPVTIEIQSVLTGKNQDLKDLKEQAEIPERRGWIFWLAAAAALAIAAIIWILWRRRRTRPISLSPEQVRNLMDLAEADLRTLFAHGLPGDGNEKLFYVQLSEIVKRILEAGYAVPTAERTTSEIINSLHGIPDMESGVIGLIESFLFRCDAVKFAKYVPSTAEHDAAANDAMQVLAKARKAAGNRQSSAGSAGAG